jgi:hypothetical protein
MHWLMQVVHTNRLRAKDSSSVSVFGLGGCCCFVRDTWSAMSFNFSNPRFCLHIGGIVESLILFYPLALALVFFFFVRRTLHSLALCRQCKKVQSAECRVQHCRHFHFFGGLPEEGARLLGSITGTVRIPGSGLAGWRIGCAGHVGQVAQGSEVSLQKQARGS